MAIDFASRVTRFGNFVAAVKAAIIAKGQTIGDSDPVETYAAKIAAITFAAEFPDITYTGNHTRQIVQYGDDWFYEWIFLSSGTLSFNEAIAALDIYLVGGGGAGGGSGDDFLYNIRGSGGGSGFDTYALNVSVDIGNYAVMIGSQSGSTSIEFTTLYTAQSGANGVSGSTPANGGVGKTTPYYLYGDTTLQRGTGAYGTVGDEDGGLGGPGCTLVPYAIAQEGVRVYWDTSQPFKATRPLDASVGYGAGANGKPVNTRGDGSVPTINSIPGVAAQGIAMLRIPIA